WSWRPSCPSRRPPEKGPAPLRRALRVGQDRTAENRELEQAGLAPPALAARKHGNDSLQAASEYRPEIKRGGAVGVQHDDIVGLRQSLEDAGKPLAAATRIGPNRRASGSDHLERRLFIHMHDLVEADGSGGELGEARRAREA